MTGSHYLRVGRRQRSQPGRGRRPPGVPVAFVGCVGADGAGRELLALLVDEGIDVSHVRRVDDEATGVALVTVAEDGANSIVVAPLANGRLAPSDIEAAGSVIDGATVVLAQMEVPAAAVEAALSRARAAGVVTILNPGPGQRAAAGTVARVGRHPGSQLDRGGRPHRPGWPTIAVAALRPARPADGGRDHGGGGGGRGQ